MQTTSSIQPSIPTRKRWQNPLNLRKFKSTSGHRDSQRACAATELLNTTIIAPASITATLPLKLAQFLLSSQAFFKPKVTTLERCAHGAQATVSLTQCVFLAVIFFNKTECSNNGDNPELMCQLLSFLGFIYNATLLVGWVPAEVSKEPHQTPDVPSAHSDASVDELCSLEQGESNSPTSNGALRSILEIDKSVH